MRISDMLKAIASWLESPDNEAILLSEYDEESLKITASACVRAADILKKGAEEVEMVEPKEDSLIDEEKIEEIAGIAEAFDRSGDEDLKRTASVLDEILLTIGANPSELEKIKEAQDSKIEDIKKKYNLRNSDYKKIEEAKKVIKSSEYLKEYSATTYPLSTRYCPDHAGVQVQRVGEATWQCSLDKKTYNYELGFTDMKGNKVPGGDVSNQVTVESPDSHSIFDTRDSRLNGR